MDKTIKIQLFVASSMNNKHRHNIDKLVQSVNDSVSCLGIFYEPFIYGETVIADANPDTQLTINQEAAKCDLFILLADNNSTIGQFTFKEYQTAHEQSQKFTNGKPHIKVFIIKEDDTETIDVKYKDENGVEYDNFEGRLMNDSKRYCQIVNCDKFEIYFKSWLQSNAHCGIGNSYSQTELSYGKHIHQNGQGLIRKSDNKYYRRDPLDGEIDKILERSPIIILEGSPYSGKTRAAYQVMKECEEWRDYNFHLYLNNIHNLSHLNNIRLNLTKENVGDVYFIDDINDIIKDKSIEHRENTSSLWRVLNGINDGNGFSKEDFGKTRIIITLSGAMHADKKTALYRTIFGTSGDKLDKYIQSITVNFDIYDKTSFLNMVFHMRKDGLFDGKIQQGNYTIGSLFIKEEDIISKIKDLYKDRDINDETKAIILKTLVGHYKYAKSTGFLWDFKELLCLYKFYGGKEEFFDRDLESLRVEGLIIKGPNQIDVDKYVIDICHKVVVSFMEDCIPQDKEKKKLSGDMLLNSSLVEYAKKCKQEAVNDNMPSVAKMCFLLCDRNNLPDDELEDLIDLSIKAIISDNKLENYDPVGGRIIYLVEISKKDNNYHPVFCETVLSCINDFTKVESYINFCKDYIDYLHKKNKNSDAAVKFYKRLIYAMFSKNNRTLLMKDEQIVLGHIFGESWSWKAPFCEEDLYDIFVLSRISPLLMLRANEVINYIAKSSLMSYDMTKAIQPKDKDATDNSRIFEEINREEDIDFENVYTKVFIPRVGEAIITALCKVDSFDEFIEVLKQIEEEIYSKEYLRSGVLGVFSWKLLKNIPTIANRLHYEDRKRLFDYLFQLDTTCTIIGKKQIDKEYDFNPARINAMNRLLELLDEFDALNAYLEMANSNLHDYTTLSHLFKNKFLVFEQLLPLVNRNNDLTNFITLNQLMDKAETKSDNNTCLKIMGIHDNNPVKLRDEKALASYLKNNDVMTSECFKILRDWHKADSKRILSDVALVSVMNKLDVDDLFEILSPDTDIDYLDKYGLKCEEVNSMRLNAVFYNILFYRAIKVQNLKDRVDNLFKKLMNDEKLCPLITDYNINANNSIISVYIKNKQIFQDYNSIATFIASINDPKFRKDNNIYEPMIWWAKENKDLNLYNTILSDAYKYFTEHFTRMDVVRMMTELYHYAPIFITDFNVQVQINYEGNTKCWKNFREYLVHLMNNNIAYIDGTFIYNTLSQMRNSVDEDIYKLLTEVATHSRVGVVFSTIEKMPQVVRRKLFWVDKNSGTITIDNHLLLNSSKIKMLWHILHNRLLSVEQVEEYRKRKKIALTQTYLNMVFKTIEKNKFNKNRDDRFDKLVGFLPSISTGTDSSTQVLSRSIQMCISMIATARTEDELNDIFQKYGFGELHSRTEAIGACMHKLISLRYGKKEITFNTISEFRKEILNNRNSINITIINTYIYTMLMIQRKELMDNELNGEKVSEILNKCWDDMNRKRKIDVHKLLGHHDETEMWEIDINVQTLSYFVEQCPDKRLVSTMVNWFDGNFYYDEKGKKSCLIDAIKNYSRAYSIDKDEVKVIASLLLSAKNESDCDKLYTSYVINNKIPKIQKRLYPLWKDMLEIEEFNDYVKNKYGEFNLQMQSNSN